MKYDPDVMDLDLGDERMVEKDVEAYGTSEGVTKAWDTRGRGRKQEEEKTYYRGSTTVALERIAKSGILKQAPSPLSMTRYSWAQMKWVTFHSDKGYVYLSTDPKVAKAYAEMKKQYAEAEPGSKVDFGVNKGAYGKPANGPPAIKDVKPVVITLNLPAGLERKVKDDPQSSEGNSSYMFKGSIPSKYISKVEMLEGGEWNEVSDWKSRYGVHAGEEQTVTVYVVLDDIKDLPKEDKLDVGAAIEDLLAKALFRGVKIFGFSGPGEEMIRACMSRVPLELLTNVEQVVATPALQPKHGEYDPSTKTVRINPLIFKLRQRFGEGPGWIFHTELALAHEIGHSIYYFLPEKLKDEWRDISGWMVGWKEGQEQPYEETRSGWPNTTSKWTHSKGIKFTRKYAKKNDDEDFADSFAFMVLNKPHQMDKGKREFLEKLVKERVKLYPQAMIQGPDKAYGERGN